jgi:hypothetical protein
MAFCALIIILIPFHSNAQVCGDADGNGSLHLSDAAYIMNYLFGDGPPPADYLHADADNHELLTISDIAIIICDIFVGGVFLPCPPENPPLDPDYNSMFEILYPQTIPGYRDHFALKLTAFSLLEPAHLSLPLEITVDGQVPDIDSIVFPEPGSDFYENSIYDLTYFPDSGIVAMGISYIAFQLGYEETFAKIYLSLTPTSDDKFVEISWTDYIPSQSNMGAGEITPLMISPCLNNITRPALNGYICGDANRDGYINISDVIHIFGVIFYDWFAPMPVVFMDANCDGILNISDAVYIINYIFISNSPVPCDC